MHYKNIFFITILLCLLSCKKHPPKTEEVISVNDTLAKYTNKMAGMHSWVGIELYGRPDTILFGCALTVIHKNEIAFDALCNSYVYKNGNMKYHYYDSKEKSISYVFNALYDMGKGEFDSLKYYYLENKITYYQSHLGSAGDRDVLIAQTQ